MTLPQHLSEIAEHRAAIAPYNFVPLPERVVKAELQAAVDQSVYDSTRHTGTIACTLMTESPLYVRCGYTPEQYAELASTPFEKLTPEQRGARAEFFNLGDLDQPLIPGSSLRGMLRALVEIAAYAKMDKVTDKPRFFFRAVAAKTDDPLARPYRDLLKNVKAGYITRRGGQWFIRPATTIGQDSFLKVRERDIPNSVGLTRMNSPSYHLQTMPVSFTHKRTPNGRTVVDLIDKPGVHAYAGTLVTSGNMIETGGAFTNRKNHCVVLEPGSAEIAIEPDAVDDYRNSLSAFQIEQLGDDGVLVENQPVFYCEPPRGGKVRYFGHSPNFRVPYMRPGAKRAATPADFVPADHKNPATIDIAEAIFGFVRPERQQDGIQALAGRVFVGDARLDPGQPDALFAEPLTPQILTTPKPTTFQHYLVQTQADRAQTGTDRQGRPIYQLPLAHYGSPTPEQTVVRGHKLYWHKGENPSLGLPPEQIDTNESQKTLIRPVRAGVHFTFSVHFENLSDVELGALLWVLRLAADERYRLNLGMGKPLGMGAVKIASEVRLSDRGVRYRSLFAHNGWASGDGESLADPAPLVDAFERYVLDQSGERAHGYQALGETLRIQCLLALLSWPGPAQAQTRYMEIERNAKKEKSYIPAARPVKPHDPTVNEYKDRPVLPTPLQVAGISAPATTALIQSTQRSGTTVQHGSEPTVPPRPKGPQLPEIGAVFVGLVLERDDELVVIEVPGFSRERAVATLNVGTDTPNWNRGERARVEVIGVRERGELTILNVKRGPKAQRK
jgi:CRISPR-associated protein (TIGR03986 family)